MKIDDSIPLTDLRPEELEEVLRTYALPALYHAIRHDSLEGTLRGQLALVTHLLELHLKTPQRSLSVLEGKSAAKYYTQKPKQVNLVRTNPDTPRFLK